MKRRGFLGLLAGAPVAAKAAAGRAAAGISGGLTALAPMAPSATYDEWEAACSGAAPSDDGWAKGRALDLLKELAGLEAKRPRWIRDARQSVYRLDPDLADARSLSTATRIRLQAERNVAEMMELRRFDLERDLSHLREQYPWLSAVI